MSAKSPTVFKAISGTWFTSCLGHKPSGSISSKMIQAPATNNLVGEPEKRFGGKLQRKETIVSSNSIRIILQNVLGKKPERCRWPNAPNGKPYTGLLWRRRTRSKESASEHGELHLDSMGNDSNHRHAPPPPA